MSNETSDSGENTLVTADDLKRTKEHTESVINERVAEAVAAARGEMARTLAKRDIGNAMREAFEADPWTAKDPALQRGLEQEVAKRIRGMQDIGELTPEEMVEKVRATAAEVAREHGESKRKALSREKEEEVALKIKQQKETPPTQSGTAPPPVTEKRKSVFDDDGFPDPDYKWPSEEEVLRSIRNEAASFLSERRARSGATV